VSSSWSPVTIVAIVEGEGDVAALPKLLYRIAAELGVGGLRVPKPFRIPRGRLIAPGGIEREVSTAAARSSGAGGVLILADADDDCPAELGPALLDRARKARPDKRIAVVLANREFEAWYLAAAPSLAGQHGFAGTFPMPEDPERRRDCKGLLTKARAAGHPYKETVDQAALASTFDMAMARAHAPSFGKFYREVAALLGVS
jgi:Domain of unknown function (DUF4276)